jgi:hypothetical protein
MGAYQLSTPRRGIVAASVRLHKPGTKLMATTEWQADAWNAYDITGQGRYVANAVANALSRCRLYIAKLDRDTGEIEGEADDVRLRPFAASPLGTSARRRENLRLSGLNLFVAGEFYLVGEAANPSDPKSRDLWYIVSGFDFDRRGSGKTFKCTRPATAGGGTAELVPSRDVICRVWTPHPKHSREADSPFRAALPDLSILATVRKREAAELDSRLTGAGIMLWPQSVDFGEKGIEGFTDKLVDAASEIIADPAHPNSLIPEMITMKAEDIEKVRVINFWSDLSESLAALTERKVLSLAQSLDAPVNMALGTEGQSNHWSAWLVSEDTITTHYDPILSRIADALTTCYLRPGIERLGGLDPDEYTYAFDTEPLRIRGDRLGDDLQLHDRELISDEVLLKSAGHTDDDMPTPDEARARYVRKLVQANPQLISDPAVVAMLGWGDAPVIIDAAPAPDTAAPAPEATPAVERPAAGPPDQSGANPPSAADRPAITAAAGPDPGGLGAVANLAVVRALELAGGRLAKRHTRDDDRARLHTTLPRVPEDNQIDQALRGAWRHLPTALATVDVDPVHVERVLDRYTRELIKRRAAHEPAALAALFELAQVRS